MGRWTETRAGASARLHVAARTVLAPLLALALAGCGWHAAGRSGEGVVGPDGAEAVGAAAERADTGAPALARRHAPRGSEPLVLIVVGFEGDAGGSGAVAYRDDVDWHELAFASADGVSSYYAEQSRGKFTWVPARERSAVGVGGNTCQADVENDGVVHVTLGRAHGHWFATRPDDAGADASAGGEASAGDGGASDQALDGDFIACMREAVRAADSYVDFDSYDGDGDGVLESDELGVGIIVAGYERDGDWMELLDDEAYPRMQAHANTLGAT
ncbi:MAG: hypothetical protein J6D54_06945, partial [Olsenella sp.]|nr:hypothetical protein [Olsenella sp.]